MTHFSQTIETAPIDPILGLNELYKKDTNPNKINLGVGVCMDEEGNIPIFKAVKDAEAHILKTQTTKTYESMIGSMDFIKHTNQLIYGDTLEENKTATAQMPAGSGALRVGFEYIKANFGEIPIYVPNVTWGNHRGIIGKTGLPIQDYPYYNSSTQSIDFDDMIATLKGISGNAVILLHVICHNPTGVDLSNDQWQTLADIFKEKQNLLPFLDCAYQGFANGLDDDIYAVRHFAEQNLNFILAYSFSKNMALYRERIGALSVHSESPDTKEAVLSQIQAVVRGIYSSPPAHGGAIVATILASPELTTVWKDELESVRLRGVSLRQTLSERIPSLNFLPQQNGLFSMIGLDKETIERLRNEHSIYIVGNSRINIAGLNQNNLDYFCNAL